MPLISPYRSASVLVQVVQDGGRPTDGRAARAHGWHRRRLAAAAIQLSMVEVGWVPHGWSEAETKSNPSASAA